MEKAKQCIKFLDSCPEPFHVVKTVILKLNNAGFLPIDESTLWKQGNKLQKGGKYYFTRNGSSIVAFTIGELYKPGNGFKVIGAHTDSPNLKLKPNSMKSSSGIIQLNVECYGGGLWHTWFDRDLSIAGRVILRSNDNTVNSKLLKIDRSILRIPNLCIHLLSASEREAFTVNKENHLMPILCNEVKNILGVEKKESSSPIDQLNPTNDTTNNESINNNEQKVQEGSMYDDKWRSGQQPELLQLIAEELQCNVTDIVDFELSLYDTQGAALSGSRSEFLCSSRLDNLASCFTAVEALHTHASNHLVDDEDVSVVALFDHEEVGSDSYSGAGSTLISDAIERISYALAENNAQVNIELDKAARQR